MVDAKREAYEERAAILEYDAHYPRKEAERIAAEMVYGKRDRFAEIKEKLK